jgi:hypothetical protein
MQNHSNPTSAEKLVAYYKTRQAAGQRITVLREGNRVAISDGTITAFVTPQHRLFPQFPISLHDGEMSTTGGDTVTPPSKSLLLALIQRVIIHPPKLRASTTDWIYDGNREQGAERIVVYADPETDADVYVGVKAKALYLLLDDAPIGPNIRRDFYIRIVRLASGEPRTFALVCRNAGEEVALLLAASPLIPEYPTIPGVLNPYERGRRDERSEYLRRMAAEQEAATPAQVREIIATANGEEAENALARLAQADAKAKAAAAEVDALVQEPVAYLTQDGFLFCAACFTAETFEPEEIAGSEAQYADDVDGQDRCERCDHFLLSGEGGTPEPELTETNERAPADYAGPWAVEMETVYYHELCALEVIQDGYQPETAPIRIPLPADGRCMKCLGLLAEAPVPDDEADEEDDGDEDEPENGDEEEDEDDEAEDEADLMDLPKTATVDPKWEYTLVQLVTADGGSQVFAFASGDAASDWARRVNDTTEATAELRGQLPGAKFAHLLSQITIVPLHAAVV